ncbi:MAG: hypothetical protein HOV81_08375 [Kofleriaceae bacterium]|nr:hypothetical protein [Kofleriaceae bacterium]
MVRSLLVLLALAAPAHANVAKWWGEGTRTSEPGGLREIAIEREDLRFDMRRVPTFGSARVSATYFLDNRGTTTVTGPLVFVAGSGMGNLEVTFDRAPVKSRSLDPAQVAALPAAWQAPLTTPSTDGGESLGYQTLDDDIRAAAFDLAIPPGKHELAILYEARAPWTKGKAPTIIYQLGYVLSPARDWGSFGKLDVTVEVPPGWRAAVSPRLTRTGDTLVGTFASLPGDTIGITMRASTSTLYAVLQYLLPLLALFVIVGGWIALRALGRRRGRAEDLRPTWPVSLPASLLWAAAIAVSGGFASMRTVLLLPEGQSGARGYGPAMGVVLAIFVGLIAIPIGMLVVRAGAKRRRGGPGPFR